MPSCIQNFYISINEIELFNRIFQLYHTFLNISLMYSLLFKVMKHACFLKMRIFLEGHSVRKSSGSAKSRHGACCNPFSCHAKYVTKGLRQYHQSIQQQTNIWSSGQVKNCALHAESTSHSESHQKGRQQLTKQFNSMTMVSKVICQCLHI